MKQYLDLLKNILVNGIEKESGRENMPNTIGISHAVIKMDLQEGFPLLTTKKMHWKGIVHELLWFLRGETNIKYLVDNHVNIWNEDAYRWYLKLYHERSIGEELTIEQFVELIRNPICDGKPTLPYWTRNDGSLYTLGDLGKVYGYQWRNQNGVDQVSDVLNGLKANPYSRYHIIDGWNKADFAEMALPPCHLLYQFIARPKRCEEGFYLDLNMYQRSCDTFLGVPFNIASMSLLLILFAKTVNMTPGIARWIGGDTHLYLSHIPMVNEQLKRNTFYLPNLVIKKELNGLDDIINLTINDFELIDYHYHPSIKAELFTGIKK